MNENIFISPFDSLFLVISPQGFFVLPEQREEIGSVNFNFVLMWILNCFCILIALLYSISLLCLPPFPLSSAALWFVPPEMQDSKISIDRFVCCIIRRSFGSSCSAIIIVLNSSVCFSFRFAGIWFVQLDFLIISSCERSCGKHCGTQWTLGLFNFTSFCCVGSAIFSAEIKRFRKKWFPRCATVLAKIPRKGSEK